MDDPLPSDPNVGSFHVIPNADKLTNPPPPPQLPPEQPKEETTKPTEKP